MSLKLPVTKQRIRTHFTYAWWQYVLLIALSVFGWNLLFSTTQYRSPDHLKVEWYSESISTVETQAAADELLRAVKDKLLPDMEEVTFVPVAYDEQYGDMQLFVWANAAQGDIYTLSKAHMKLLADNGGMADLQPYVDNGTLNVEGIDLTGGYYTNADTGEQYLGAIPMDSLKGLARLGIVPEGQLMGLLAANGNDENCLKLMNWILENMKE